MSEKYTKVDLNHVINSILDSENANFVNEETNQAQEEKETHEYLHLLVEQLIMRLYKLNEDYK